MLNTTVSVPLFVLAVGESTHVLADVIRAMLFLGDLVPGEA